MTPRLLTADEIALASQLGLEFGVDGDDRAEQHHHICWPYAAYTGALCDSPHLWFHAGLVEPAAAARFSVSCEPCFVHLDQLRDLKPILKDVIGRLAEAVNTATPVLLAAHTGSPELVTEALAANLARHARLAEALAARAAARRI